MAQAVIVRGLHETQLALKIAGLKFHTLKVGALKRFGQKVREVARENCPVDTGALRASIHEKLLKESIEETIEAVIAGHEDVIRGEGRYTFSTKEGKMITKKQPTTRYAEFVELGINQPKAWQYMEQAFQWAESHIDREIRKLLNEALKGL